MRASAPAGPRSRRAGDPLEEAEEERAGSRTWPGQGPLRARAEGNGGRDFSGMRSSRGKVKLLPGVRAGGARGARGGSARGGPRLLRGRRRGQSVPECGGWARGRGEGLGGGVGVEATTTAPLSRDEAGLLLSRCAPSGSRCAPNFKAPSACWRSVGVNVGTSSGFLAAGVCACMPVFLFVCPFWLLGENKTNLMIFQEL